MKEEQGSSLNIDFGINVDSLKMKYLDPYEDVYADMVYTNRFDKNSDLSTTYLGQTKMNRDKNSKKDFPLLDKALHWENCWMGLIVRFC